MKKSIFMGILTCLIFSAFAMEEQKMSISDARRLYWNTAKAEFSNAISYEDYRSNMVKAINSLDPTRDPVQDMYSDPLYNAACEGDYNFAKFLLDHAANPRFGEKSGKSALQYLGRQRRRDPNNAKAESLYNLLRSYIIRQK